MTASSLTNISKLLVANRGEIACRIIRTAHMLGIETIAIYAPADAKAPHVRLATHAVPLNPLPQANPGVGYLDADRIVAIGLDQQADAVHPGYGFLSENAEFAAKVEAAGMRFVGPTPDVIAKMGDKLAARQVAIDAGVPTTPGGDTPVSDPDRATVVANEIGYPVLIKAVAGGGGKGMQIVHNPTSFAEALSAARGIAEKAFGDSRVFIEKYISAPRHIEIQILADGQGGVAILGERDCTVQRRHQKVIEEAPAVFIPDAMREQM
ncbi:MAG: ATP-grasp domain-containing protein, partial [Alphaproteobacteria bacterium]|nr:ATP-grasp domain-containing protein [Alphaproteobacteria bacterium]